MSCSAQGSSSHAASPLVRRNAASHRRIAVALAALYTADAINHQVAEAPVQVRTNIREMFARGFAPAMIACIVENMFQDGEWTIPEWRDPNGLRGSGFFHVVNGQIQFQRGYWDKLSFLRLQGLPIPREPPGKQSAL